MFIRAFTAAHIELWSNSSPFVQLQCFQMRGGSRCLVLNLNPSFIFEKTKSFFTFLPHLKAFLHIRNTFLRVHMAFKELVFCFFFLLSLLQCSVCPPLSWEQEAGAGGRIPGHCVLRGSSSSGLEELSMHRDPRWLLLQPVGF